MAEGVSGGLHRRCWGSGRPAGEDRPAGMGPRGPSLSGPSVLGPVPRGRACDSQQRLQLGRLGPGQPAQGSLSCSGSSDAAARAWPASQQEGAEGAGEEHSVTLHCSRNSNQTGGGGPAGDRRPHLSALAEEPLGWGWQVLLAPHRPCFLPRTLASPSTRRDKDPGLPVCAPQRQLERRGWARALGQPPPLWAKLGWKHSDRPRLSAPCPQPGE